MQSKVKFQDDGMTYVLPSMFVNDKSLFKAYYDIVDGQ